MYIQLFYNSVVPKDFLNYVKSPAGLEHLSTPPPIAAHLGPLLNAPLTVDMQLTNYRQTLLTHMAVECQVLCW